MTPLAVAFLPLTDAAVLIAAQEKGFARDHDIALTLVRTESWATVRDRLVYGQVQAAHMLAPLAVAVTLGLSQHPAALAAPFKLNVNGNALVMTPAFAVAMDPQLDRRIADPLGAAHDFATAIGLYHRKPVIGIVHRFSSHALMLRYWLAAGGVDPDRDVVLRVLPPSFMGDAVQRGEIDGFIAGEPWGSAAVETGAAEMVAVGARIWQRGIEKVLAMREDWMEAQADTVDRLLLALSAAAAWCDVPDHHGELADMLAQPHYVGQSAALIRPGLDGALALRRGAPPVAVPEMLLFHREAAGFPWRSQALWIYSQLVRWGMCEASAGHQRAAAGVLRSDIYRRALGGGGEPMPGASMKLEGALSSPLQVGTHRGALTLGPDRFFDGRVFDPEDIAGYIGGPETGTATGLDRQD